MIKKLIGISSICSSLMIPTLGMEHTEKNLSEIEVRKIERMEYRNMPTITPFMTNMPSIMPMRTAPSPWEGETNTDETINFSQDEYNNCTIS